MIIFGLSSTPESEFLFLFLHVCLSKLILCCNSIHSVQPSAQGFNEFDSYFWIFRHNVCNALLYMSDLGTCFGLDNCISFKTKNFTQFSERSNRDDLFRLELSHPYITSRTPSSEYTESFSYLSGREQHHLIVLLKFYHVLLIEYLPVSFQNIY